MARAFEIPDFYRSNIVTRIKRARQNIDSKKRDLLPSSLDLGPVRLKLARHFGFCFGVENAIEIAYRALEENSDRRVFLLSEMIHNPHVNNDLVRRGARFLMNTAGEVLIPFDTLTPDDIVIVPAFGTTLELFNQLRECGIEPTQYNATCPFVEKVWRRSQELGERGFSVIIHGKHSHEETRATFSHARVAAPSLVIRDLYEAELLSRYIQGELSGDEFSVAFSGRYSEGFDPARDLLRIGVVNQTTMLAEETHAIARQLRSAMEQRFGSAALAEHFADTRDTLCYATSENQRSTQELIRSGGDVAIVVGGYNSSNTSHLAELLESRCPTYYVRDEQELLSSESIRHFDFRASKLQTSENWVPQKSPIDILVAAGASCPDSVVERVLYRLAELFGCEDAFESSAHHFFAAMPGPRQVSGPS